MKGHYLLQPETESLRSDARSRRCRFDQNADVSSRACRRRRAVRPRCSADCRPARRAVATPDGRRWSAGCWPSSTWASADCRRSMRRTGGDRKGPWSCPADRAERSRFARLALHWRNRRSSAGRLEHWHCSAVAGHRYRHCGRSASLPTDSGDCRPWARSSGRCFRWFRLSVGREENGEVNVSEC